MPFFVCHKVRILSKILSKILPKVLNFATFSSSENEAFSPIITITAFNLFYEVLPKQFRGFWPFLAFSLSLSEGANFVKNSATNLEFCHFLSFEIECLL